MTMVERTREQIAWAAGLFEGEGCFGTYQRQNHRIVKASLAMTDGDVVRRFAAVIGIGQVRGPYLKRSDEKPMYEWFIGSAPDVLKVIDLLLPWLGIRRAAKAREVAAVAITIGPYNGLRKHCPKGHPYEGSNLMRERPNGTGRRCRICRNEQSRNRARKRLGIPPERWRV